MRGFPLFTAIAILGLSTGGEAQPTAQVKVPTFTPGIPRLYQPQPAPRSSSQLPKIPTGTGRCGQLAAIINSDRPTEGALASLEHAVSVLKAGIERIDLACDGASSALRPTYYSLWQQTRANCLQLTSGATTYAELPAASPCKEEVSSK